MKSSVVPVFPAAGQPMFAAVPVPPSITPLRMSVTSYATPSENTRWRSPSSGSSTSPFGNSTRVTARGVLRIPPSASVAEPFAISSGVTPIRNPPIPSAGTASRVVSMPMSYAVSRTFSGPRSRSIWANTVLSEAWVASRIDIEQPHALPSAVVTLHGPYSGRFRLRTLDS